MKIIFFLVLGYVMGALPNGVWLGKYFKNIDIRAVSYTHLTLPTNSRV